MILGQEAIANAGSGKDQLRWMSYAHAYDGKKQVGKVLHKKEGEGL